MKLSIVIPVYNERRCFNDFWEGLKKAPINKCAFIREVEIIIVDDGSTDGTSQLVKELCDKPFVFDCDTATNVKFLPQSVNRGKGAALIVGINNTTGDLVLVQDADLEYSPQDYPILLQPLGDGKADAVFGSRFIGSTRRVLYFWHALANHFLTFLSNMFCNLNATDMETCYKVMRGALARSLRLTSKRFGIEPEMVSRLARSGARIFEVPISYSGRTYSEGKKIRARDGVAALYHILKFGIWDRNPFKSGMEQKFNKVEAETNKSSQNLPLDKAA
ncbi:MAG: glycosyltransferase family 2 protein [Bdellovibrionota bacterium]